MNLDKILNNDDSGDIGLKLLGEFMKECKSELTVNYESLIEFRDKKEPELELPSFIEFAMMEFIKESYNMFEDVMSNGIPDDVKMVSKMLEDKDLVMN